MKKEFKKPVLRTVSVNVSNLMSASAQGAPITGTGFVGFGNAVQGSNNEEADSKAFLFNL